MKIVLLWTHDIVYENNFTEHITFLLFLSLLIILHWTSFSIFILKIPISENDNRYVLKSYECHIENTIHIFFYYRK